MYVLPINLGFGLTFRYLDFLPLLAFGVFRSATSSISDWLFERIHFFFRFQVVDGSRTTDDCMLSAIELVLIRLTRGL